MKLSIKHVLIAGIIGLQVVTVAAIGLSSYASTEKVLIGHARQIMENLASDTIKRSTDFLRPAESAAGLTQRLSNHNIVSSGDPVAMERYFYEQLRQSAQIAGIYYGSVDGDFFYVSHNDTKEKYGFRTKIVTVNGNKRSVQLIWRKADFRHMETETDPADTYDPRERPWFKKAVNEGGAIWTEPYVFFTSRLPGITAATPVIGADGKLKGVVGVDIEISKISSFLKDLKTGNKGSAFILNRNGDVIAFPDSQKIKQPLEDDSGGLRFTRIDELDDPVSRAAYDSLGHDLPEFDMGKTETTSFDYGGERYLAVFAPFASRNWPWVMGVTVEENFYLGALKDNQLFNVYLAVGIALIACIVGFFIARGISSPMALLRANALSIKAHGLSEVTPIHSTFDEINETGEAFTEMVRALIAEEALNAQLNEQIRKLSRSVEQSPAAIMITDTEGVIEYVNPRFTHMTGYDAKDVVGKPSSLLTAKDADDKAHKKLWKTVKAGLVWRGELLNRKKNGDPQWIESIISPLKDGDGVVNNYISVSEDITERKKSSPPGNEGKTL